MGSDPYSVSLSLLATKVEQLNQATQQLASMSNSASNEFGNTAGEMKASEVHDAILTFSDSWMPMLQKLADSCEAIAKALGNSVEMYSKAESNAENDFGSGK